MELIVADRGSHTIRRIAADGTVSTVCGDSGNSGFSDGTGRSATFSSPSGVAVSPDGTIYVTDTDNQTIRRITSSGSVSTLCGSVRKRGQSDGKGTAAR